MGTFYTIGIIKEFSAQAIDNLTKEEWKELLNHRIDTELFTIDVENNEVKASLHSDVFSDNIVNFYEIFKEIAGPELNPNIEYYAKECGGNIENYQIESSVLFVKDSKGRTIQVDVEFAMLFIEGKVLVEEFYTEPQLLNWLFRNSKIENKLAGCVISDVIG